MNTEKRITKDQLARRAYSSRYGARTAGDEIFRTAWLIGWKLGYRAAQRAARKIS